MGPFGVLVPGGSDGSRRLVGPSYAECVSTGLHSRLLIKRNQLEKKVDMQRQETEKLPEDWVWLLHHFENMKAFCKDMKEVIHNHHSQIHQVGAGRWVRLRSGTIFPRDCLSAHPATCAFTIILLMHAPIQPPTSCYLGAHFSVHAQVLLGS